ncbi:ribbon-helix-helix protein, CopG family [Fimbriimonas ginsengisoli]|uniref:Ribbon-helix-helix protein CopG domain-containing protein n=1 Tax=Fimbriimonas ginsengisoli Gsoil 348 TaxID=661478 RepID=A0A068NQ84_FIMGI|nr:ribbon-helix-helix protein, CopG family [Fimbriimonas ginsengisoli]AIE85546.1 hypothetical protein OP10G_2178 [Fimbriimonas ginsengisoli Gsoil 348]
MSKVHIGVRIQTETADRIEKIAKDRGRSQTQVIEQLLELGLQKLDQEALAEGFALLGSSEMQDMDFPTGAQQEAYRVAD